MSVYMSYGKKCVNAVLFKPVAVHIAVSFFFRNVDITPCLIFTAGLSEFCYMSFA